MRLPDPVVDSLIYYNWLRPFIRFSVRLRHYVRQAFPPRSPAPFPISSSSLPTLMTQAQFSVSSFFPDNRPQHWSILHLICDSHISARVPFIPAMQCNTCNVWLLDPINSPQCAIISEHMTKALCFQVHSYNSVTLKKVAPAIEPCCNLSIVKWDYIGDSLLFRKRKLLTI